MEILVVNPLNLRSIGVHDILLDLLDTGHGFLGFKS